MPLFILFRGIDSLVFSHRRTSLLDACSLTSELAQIVELGTTHLTVLVNLDGIDVRRLDGEDTLHTNGSRHLAYGETLLVAMTVDFDNYTAEELDTLFVTLDDFVSNCHGVAGTELRKLLASGKCFFSNFN